ncbi:MAG TPA: glycosyltransferase family 4 protein [Steroidobacteraceae bacterium]|jgi:glycosyltransferase involved in cell wall biosynthesis|nr:glycosyltransferase family 4 protein [Steroidobacteraceae bacterium]
MSARKICIVGLDSYGMLSGEGNPKYIGGEAIQHVLLAKAWRDLGHDVSMIVHDEGQGARTEVDGIKVIAAHTRDGGIRGLRFFHPRATKLLSALIAADADVYYQSPAGANTGITAWFCRATDRRFIFRVASDSDCGLEHERIQFWRDRKLYHFGLRRANLIASQTDYQARLLRENHRLESVVLNMMVEVPRTTAAVDKDIDVLWVSNLRALKRPELALELARQLPQVKFTLAGGPMPGGQTYYDDVEASAARLSNVTMLGPVRYRDSGTLFDRARIFINTSTIEGFPNTFLQAWIRSVPVVTFFDPDGLVKRFALGRVASSLDEMREAIRDLVENQAGRDTLGRNAREFAMGEYTTGVAARYLDILNQHSPQLRLGAANGASQGADLP